MYSDSFKERVLWAYHNKIFGSISELVYIFKISRSTLYCWIHKRIRKCKPKTNKINNTIVQHIIKHTLQNNKLNRSQLIKNIKLKFNYSISESSLYRILKLNKITWKKCKRRLIYKNALEHKKQVMQFKNNIKKISPKNIISIDETSIDNCRIANYGWNYSGKEVVRKKYIKKRVRYTLICGISMKGIDHAKLIIGSAKSEDFNEFIKELTKTKDNMHLLMDNAAIHHNKKLTGSIQNNNKVIYNAPYCPEYNPIEMLFSKIKRHIETTKSEPIKDQVKKK